MRASRLTPVAVACLVARLAFADLAPVGPELQVNTYTTGDQSPAQVSADGAGDFVVTWQSGARFSTIPGPDGSESGIAARRFDAAGTPQGAEFVVNTYTAGPQTSPAIAADAAGGFIVAWQGGDYFEAQDGSEAGAFLQRFSAAGARTGDEVRANTTVPGSQRTPKVAVDAAGSFVVVWESDPSYRSNLGGDGDRSGIFAQRYDASGAPLGSEFQVNTYTLGYQRTPAVAMAASGAFVVVWDDAGYYGGRDGSGTAVVARAFDASGTPLGDDFQVNTYTTGNQRGATVAIDGAGNFVVAWQSYAYSSGAQDGDGSGVFAQRFTAAATPAGAEFQVNSRTTGSQRQPTVALDGAGNFVVVWEDDEPSADGDAAGVFGQHFSGAGERLGDEFQANTYTTASQFSPTIAADPAGDFIVAWTSGFSGGTSQDGDGLGIFAQRFRTSQTEPARRLAGERLTLRDDPADPRHRRLSLRARGVAMKTRGDADDDPTLSGAVLRVSSATFDHAYDLPALHWRHLGALGSGRGWVYEDRALLAGPIASVVVRPDGVRIAGKGAQLDHVLASNPDPVSVTLRLGSTGLLQCLSFGGAAKFEPDTLFRARNAPAPASCTR